MAEQAQDNLQEEAQDLDALQDALPDAPAQVPQSNTPPSQVPAPAANQPAPQLQPERAQLIQNLLNAIPIASADQITRMLQVFAPQAAQVPQPSQINPAPPSSSRPQGRTYPLPPRVWGDATTAMFDPLGHLLPQPTRKRCVCEEKKKKLTLL